jgi:hypothetical protein
VQWYNSILEYGHQMPVHSLVVLLRPEADAPNLTGVWESAFAGEEPYRIFRYQVVRVWQMPLASLLEAGLGLLPLAPICDEAAAKLPAVIRRMEKRFQLEAGSQDIGSLWTATDVLMGLR